MSSITRTKRVASKPKVALDRKVRSGGSTVVVQRPLQNDAGETKKSQLSKVLGQPGTSMGIKTASAARQLQAGSLVARSKPPKFQTKQQANKKNTLSALLRSYARKRAANKDKDKLMDN